jgi:hypothetical protein
MHLCTSVIVVFMCGASPVRFPLHTFSSKIMHAVVSAGCHVGESKSIWNSKDISALTRSIITGVSPMRCCHTSTTRAQERAALVQMAREGRVLGHERD